MPWEHRDPGRREPACYNFIGQYWHNLRSRRSAGPVGCAFLYFYRKPETIAMDSSLERERKRRIPTLCR